MKKDESISGIFDYAVQTFEEVYGRLIGIGLLELVLQVGVAVILFMLSIATIAGVVSTGSLVEAGKASSLSIGISSIVIIIMLLISVVAITAKNTNTNTENLI